MRAQEAQPVRSNAVGMAGFILIIITTILSPTGFCGVTLIMLIPAAITGLILSTVGIFNRPRWPGIAGLTIGLLCLSFWLSFFGNAFYRAYADARKLGLTISQHTEMSMAAMALFEQAEAQRPPGGPAAPIFSFSPVPAEYQNDPWSRPYRYVLISTGRGYTFFSDGPDGVVGTADDLDLSKIQVGDMFSLPAMREGKPTPAPTIPAAPPKAPATTQATGAESISSPHEPLK